MKQGPSNKTRDGSYQTPVTRGINPGWADQLGQALAKSQAAIPMYDGKRGISAPPSARVVHPHGTQGKHR